MHCGRRRALGVTGSLQRVGELAGQRHLRAEQLGQMLPGFSRLGALADQLGDHVDEPAGEVLNRSPEHEHALTRGLQAGRVAAQAWGDELAPAVLEQRLDALLGLLRCFRDDTQTALLRVFADQVGEDLVEQPTEQQRRGLARAGARVRRR